MQTMLADLVNRVDSVLVGKHAQVELAVCCLVAGGHLLIEDLPGVGKTTLAHALAHVFGLQQARVQFTADLLPSDVLGVSVYARDVERFVFHPGPVFTELLLADEINRAPPKTQSALLEAMEERQVSVDGASRALPPGFFVIATQNPADQRGTYALPESQLDRFLMCLSLGYPDAATERELLLGEDRRALLARLPRGAGAPALQALQRAAAAVPVAPALADYVQRLLAARAYALLRGRDYCSPQDVQAVFVAVAAHRLHGGAATAAQLDALLRGVEL